MAEWVYVTEPGESKPRKVTRTPEMPAEEWDRLVTQSRLGGGVPVVAPDGGYELPQPDEHRPDTARSPDYGQGPRPTAIPSWGAGKFFGGAMDKASTGATGPDGRAALISAIRGVAREPDLGPSAETAAEPAMVSALRGTSGIKAPRMGGFDLTAAGGSPAIVNVLRGARMQPVADMSAPVAPKDSGELPKWLTDAITPAGMPMSRRARDQYALQAQQFRATGERVGLQQEMEARRAASKREQELEDEASRRKWQEGQSDLNRKSQERAASLAAGRIDARDAAKAEKEAEENAAELGAPGWERAEGAPAIKREEAAGFRVAIGSAKELNGSSAQMRTLIKKHGSELYGPRRAEMANLSRDMLLKMKDLAKLGVLSKSDEDILNDLIPNPTGVGGATTSTESMLAQLDAFDKSVSRKLDAQAHALGYKKPGAKIGAGAASVSGLSPEKQARREALQKEIEALRAKMATNPSGTQEIP